MECRNFSLNLGSYVVFDRTCFQAQFGKFRCFRNDSRCIIFTFAKQVSNYPYNDIGMFRIRVSKGGNNLDLGGDNQISKNINLYDLFDRPIITFS